MGREHVQDVEIQGKTLPEETEILSEEALLFLKELHEHFEPKRQALLQQRKLKQAAVNQGADPFFLRETQAIREDETWRVGDIPPDLERRWVEITGPVERKMMINAFNSGADIFMADFEDALSPTWKNVIEGQKNLIEAVAGTISFKSPEGKEYQLKPKIATLMVRPRGFHLNEKHLLIEGTPISASLFDFGLFFFHNHRQLLEKGTGPYFYLPKLEGHLEAKLWNDIFLFSQDKLKIPRGTIKATVLIETIFAAFEMEEILYALKDHITGLNAGRWDYIFSIIKKFVKRSSFLLPDRSQVTMTVPFMRAYTDLLVKTCHKRGAHAIGGMAAFIPNRKMPEVTENALMRVREDKMRESKDGFDGTWVAHPDLVDIAREIFEKALKGKNHQKEISRREVHTSAENLLNFAIAGGAITETGFNTNVSVALHYLKSWLEGQGAVAINNLMEDAATAEISRSQLWQWIHHKAAFAGGAPVTKELFESALQKEIKGKGDKNWIEAGKILSDLVKTDQFEEFLTLGAYRKLD